MVQVSDYNTLIIDMGELKLFPKCKSTYRTKSEVRIIGNDQFRIDVVNKPETTRNLTSAEIKNLIWAQTTYQSSILGDTGQWGRIFLIWSHTIGTFSTCFLIVPYTDTVV